MQRIPSGSPRESLIPAALSDADPLRLAIGGSPLCVATMDRDLRYTWAYNPSGDLAAPDLIGHTDAELYGTQAAPITALKQRALTLGTTERDLVGLMISGRWHTLDLYIAPLRHPSGAIYGLSCMTMTIPAPPEPAPAPPPVVQQLPERAAHPNGVAEQRRQIADALRFYTQLLEHVRHAIVALDRDMRITYWNDCATDLYGWSAAEMIGQNLYRLGTATHTHIVYDEIVQTLARREIWSGEVDTANHQGQPLLLLVTVSPLYDSQGQLSGAISVAVDLSARRQMEQALRASRRYLERVMEVAPAVIFVYDLALQRCVFVNSEAHNVLGYGPEEMQRMGIDDLLGLVVEPPPSAIATDHTQIMALPDGAIFESELRLAHADGSIHWLSQRITIFARDEQGRPTQVLGAAIDITARKSEEQRKQREAEQNALFGTLAQAINSAGFDETDLLRTIAVKLADHMQTGCIINLLTPDWALLPVAWHHPRPASYARLEALAQCPTRWVGGPGEQAFSAGRPLRLTAELRAQLAQLDPDLAALLSRMGVTDMIATPLRLRDRFFGILTLIEFDAAAIQMGDSMVFLLQIANSTALALDNARLFRAAQHELAARDRAEESIRLQARLLDLVDEAVVATETGGRLIYSNQAARRLYGGTADQPHASAFQQMARLIPARQAQQIGRAISHGKSWRGEVSFALPDGRQAVQLVSSSPILDHQGQVVGSVSIATDISERKRAEEDLRLANTRLSELNIDLQRSRDLLSTIFAGLTDGLLLLDRSGIILASNQRLEPMLGDDHTLLVGQSWAERYNTPKLHPISACVMASLADGQGRQARARITGSDQILRILDVLTLPQLDAQQRLEQLAVHIRDVTEQVQFEAQVVEQERFLANSRLAATVAHEVNTPLQAIESCLHLAGRSDGATQARYLRLAREEIQRIGLILRQLLDLYRASGSSAAPFDLNALIERVLLLTGSSMARQGIQIVRSLDPQLPPILGRADAITQVLLNLIVNATQAMPHGGKLFISTRTYAQDTGESQVWVTVGDTGGGIAPELIERIFEPFFTTRVDGNGLGLAVSRRIIADHSGQLIVESTPGVGSRFSVTLPIAVMTK